MRAGGGGMLCILLYVWMSLHSRGVEGDLQGSQEDQKYVCFELDKYHAPASYVSNR